MTLSEFKATLDSDRPPDSTTGPQAALWHLAKGDWAYAHKLAQDHDDRDGAWVHAHLHRVEGDQANAGFWYREAGRPVSTLALADEWDEIAMALLDQHPDGRRGD